MGGSRVRPPSAPAGLHRDKPKIEEIDKEVSEEWFQPNVPDPTATGQLGKYMRAPVQKGMCNPPCNEKVRQELLEYLLQNGIQTEVPKTHLSTTAPPDGIRPRPASASAKLSGSAIQQQGQMRPASASGAYAQQSHQKQMLHWEHGQKKKRPESAPVKSRRPLSPSKSQPINPDRPLSAEVHGRREKRIAEGSGDLRSTFKSIRKATSEVSVKKRKRASSGSTFVSQRSDLSFLSKEKSYAEWRTHEATSELKIQSRLHRFESSKFTDEEIGELNMYHNGPMRNLNPSKLRTEDFLKLQSGRDTTTGSPTGRRKNRGPAPSPWHRDKSAYKIMTLQSRVGKIHSSQAASVNWHMPRDPTERVEGRSCEDQIQSMHITRAVSRGEESEHTVQRYTTHQMERMQSERDLAGVHINSDEPARKKNLIKTQIREDIRLDCHNLVEGVLHRGSDIHVHADELSAADIAHNQDMHSLGKRHKLDEGLVEALWEKFDQLDSSGNGFLEPLEFKSLVKWLVKDANLTDEVVHKLWKEFDRNGRWEFDGKNFVDKGKDGGISFEEFLVWFIRKMPNFAKMTATQLRHYMGDL